MRVGVISDVHANLPALRAVLDDMPHVDGLVCAGDVVGYNPWPIECIDILREHNVPAIMGNHDRAVLTPSTGRFNTMAQAAIEYTRTVLDIGSIEWLKTLPDDRYTFDGRIRIVHGHPDDPNRYTYPESFHPGLLHAEEVLVLGHTHVQHAEVYETGIVCNPGSVGQPRDGDPRAAYAIVEMSDMSVEQCRVQYDVAAVDSKLGVVGLPPDLGARLYEGR